MSRRRPVTRRVTLKEVDSRTRKLPGVPRCIRNCTFWTRSCKKIIGRPKSPPQHRDQGRCRPIPVPTKGPQFRSPDSRLTPAEEFRSFENFQDFLPACKPPPSQSLRNDSSKGDLRLSRRSSSFAALIMIFILIIITTNIIIPIRCVVGPSTANWENKTLQLCTHRAQYPLIKEYTLNNKGLHIMIYAIFLN